MAAKVDVYGYDVVVLEKIKGIKLSNWVVDDTDDQELPLKSFSKSICTEVFHRNAPENLTAHVVIKNVKKSPTHSSAVSLLWFFCVYIFCTHNAGQRRKKFSVETPLG